MKKFLLSISTFALIQPLLYTLVKFLQFNYYTITTYIDTIIPFIPHFIYIYNLFYIFIILSFYYIYKKDQKLYFLGINTGVICMLISYLTYIIFPTLIIRPNLNLLNIDPITNLILYVTYKVDNPAINCFPSIHCTFCFIILFITNMSHKINIKNKLFINIFSILIIISTLLVKQHYILDIISSFILTIIVLLIIKKNKF